MNDVAVRVQERTGAAVARALSAVIAGIDDSQTDPAGVDALSAVLAAAFPSFLGLTITVQTGLRAVTTSTDAPVVIGTANACLLLLLDPHSEPGSSALFYAAERGAFDRLAASKEWRLCGYDPVVLDPYLQRV